MEAGDSGARWRVARVVPVALLVVAALAALPAAARTDDRLAGRLHVVWQDPLPGSGEAARTRVFLLDDTGWSTELRGLDVAWAAALEGERVEAHGARDGDALRASQVRPLAQGSELEYWQARPLRGPQRWVSILCRFPDSNPATERPVAHFEGLMGPDEPGMGHYFEQVSYGAIDVVDPQVAGWYTLPHPRDHYGSIGNFDYGLATEDCTALADADVRFTDFDGVNLMFNDGLDGLAMGGSWTLVRDGQEREYGMTWEPIFGYENQQILAHEMGHAFGLPHSSGQYGATYDSFWDVMSGGGACRVYHPAYNCVGVETIGVHKDLLGWLPEGRRLLATSPSRQTVEIERLAQPDEGGYLLALIPIQGSLTQLYAVEARRPVGYDRGLPNEGILIHRVDLTQYERFAQVVDADGNGDPNDAGAAWTPGETFRDEASRISVAVEADTGSGYTVTIDVSDAYHATWERTDLPVAAARVSRTWMWGPEPFSGTILEPYVDAPDELRAVRYYDKSRMEISDPAGDPNSIWYVTNGLLVLELVTGRLQLGDNLFEQQQPAEVNVAGDADPSPGSGQAPAGPTYATFNPLRSAVPHPDGALISARLDRAGSVRDDPALAGYGATAAGTVPQTNHRVASPFWEFMNSQGTVWEDGQYVSAPLFENPYYATGYPIAEAYWTTVLVGGTPHDVLVQCFERRCLTWTPGNPEGWQVEAGNVGRHYEQWRYARPAVEGRLLWTAGRDTAGDIMLLSAGEAEPRNLTATRGYDGEAAWSPNGERIAFRSERGGLSDIWTMAADGSDARQLTFGMDAWGPSWSPDGTRIAFAASTEGPTPTGPPSSDIFVVDAAGGEPRRLTTDPMADVDPAWSPDGATIVFASDRAGTFDLFLMGPDGGNQRAITSGGWNDTGPVVSPDGSRIAYERDQGLNGDIWVVGADGSNPTRLTISPAWDSEPAWSPDGGRIAFSTTRRAGGEEIYLMQADGSDQRNLSNAPGSDHAPDWGP